MKQISSRSRRPTRRPASTTGTKSSALRRNRAGKFFSQLPIDNLVGSGEELRTKTFELPVAETVEPETAFVIRRLGVARRTRMGDELTRAVPSDDEFEEFFARSILR